MAYETNFPGCSLLGLKCVEEKPDTIILNNNINTNTTNSNNNYYYYNYYTPLVHRNRYFQSTQSYKNMSRLRIK